MRRDVYRVMMETCDRKKHPEDLGVIGKMTVKHNWWAFVNVVWNLQELLASQQ
jgi:hypothetical protein